jgi:hypothetical protein
VGPKGLIRFLVAVDAITLAVMRRQNSYEITKMLLEAGGRPIGSNVGSAIDHETALDYAVCIGDKKLVKLLLQYDAARGSGYDPDNPDRCAVCNR